MLNRSFAAKCSATYQCISLPAQRRTSHICCCRMSIRCTGVCYNRNCADMFLRAATHGNPQTAQSLPIA